MKTWSTTTGAELTLSSTHSQGAFSLAVVPSPSNGYTPIASMPLSTLSEVSPTLAVDVMLPQFQANPYWLGILKVVLDSPTASLYSQNLAQVELVGPLNSWKTYYFSLDNAQVAALLKTGYTDLVITVALGVQVPTTGQYLIDNLRFVPVPASGCSGRPNGTACTDDNACTVGDTCQSNACRPGPLAPCAAPDQCHDNGVCNPSTGACSYQNKPDGTGCDDNNICTSHDSCHAGTCSGGTPSCPSPGPCQTGGTCDPIVGDCVYQEKPEGSECSDGDPCTLSDTCQGGTCLGTPRTCPLGSCQAVGTCDPDTGECSYVPDIEGAECDDHNPCTEMDTCHSGQCLGDQVPCTAGPCQVGGVCDLNTGACSYQNLPDGTACDDGVACTTTDACVGGSCSGQMATCTGVAPDGNPVTAHCGQTACLAGSTTYMCNPTGWTSTGQSCTVACTPGDLVLENPHKNLPYFLKGQMHAHSHDGDDGDVPPTQLADFYSSYGYSFMGITDHSKSEPTKDPRSSTGLLHILSMEDGNHYNRHMGVVGIDISREDTRICSDNPPANGICDLDTAPAGNTQTRIDFYNSQGAISTLHHPSRWPFGFCDQKNRTGYTAVEVWCTNTSPQHFDEWWDRALSYGHRSFAVAADDFEKWDQRFSGGWINVSSSVKPAEMKAALKYALAANEPLYQALKKAYTAEVLKQIHAGNFFAVAHVNARPRPQDGTVPANAPDPGPKVTITTLGHTITVAVAPDEWSGSDSAFRVTPVMQRWAGETSLPPPTMTSQNGQVSIDLNAITNNKANLYRYIRLEIEQDRHCISLGPLRLCDTYRVFSQPIYMTFCDVPLPTETRDNDYENRDWIATKDLAYEGTPKTAEILNAEAIGLFNNNTRAWVRYGSRKYGINLGWSSTETRSVHLVRQGTSEGAIAYGEPLALRVDGGSYVKYERRRWGINLVWSSTPVYQWVLTGGPVGKPVHALQPFGLKNTYANDSVVYCPRDYGINLMWRNDCTKPEHGRIDGWDSELDEGLPSPPYTCQPEYMEYKY